MGKHIPLTMLAFFIGSLSIIGLPPTAGLWSKLSIAVGSLDVGLFFPVAVLLLSSLLNIAYLLPIPVRAFFRPVKQGVDESKLHSEPLACKIAICITMTGCIALFFFANRVTDLLYPITQ